MEIKKYFLLVKKWFWLLLIGSILGGIAGAVLGMLTKPVYHAQTKVLVTRNRQDPNFEFAYLNDQQLLETYIELLKTQTVLNVVSEKVGFTVDPRRISIAQVRQTQIILISVEDQSPEHTAQIANTLIEVLIEQNDKLQTSKYAATEASLSLQIKNVESQLQTLRAEFDQSSQEEIQKQLTQADEQITQLESEISALEKDIASLGSIPQDETKSQESERQVQLAEKQALLGRLQPLLLNYQQIKANLLFLGQPSQLGATRENFRTVQLQSTLNLYQELYLNLLNSLESLQLLRLQYSPNIDQIEPAVVPKTPIRPSPLRYTVFGVFAGVVLAGVAIIAIEFLDDTIKSPKDVLENLGLYTISSIPEFSTRGNQDEGIFILKNPKSPIADAFRLLRTSILSGPNQKGIKTLLIVSPEAKDGRSSIALNLAASFSMLGRRVTVVDANIRAPHLHTTLGVNNEVGLSDILAHKADITTATRSVQGPQLINALTGGNIPDNPTELLESDRLGQILNNLTAKVDLVVLDGPPIFLTADALAFASKVDGVLLVLRTGKTRIETAQAAVEYLQRSGCNILGVVLSRVPRNWAKYHEGFLLTTEQLHQ